MVRASYGAYVTCSQRHLIGTLAPAWVPVVRGRVRLCRTQQVGRRQQNAGVAPGGGMAPRRGSFPTACPGVLFSSRLYKTLAEERKSRPADSNPRRQEGASGQYLGRSEPLHPPQSPPPASPHPSSYTRRGLLLFVVLDVQDSPGISPAKLASSLKYTRMEN